jgi:GTP diphosphokinase / guanosine-3',5'-bis(diphosphate) 3'-diphosphatase
MQIQSVIQAVKEYLPEADLDIIQLAFDYADIIHDGEFRASGEPYIQHPLAVAMILARMQLDVETIAAALLHDVVEDGGIPIEKLESKFGPKVARLVDGVTKLSTIRWGSAEEQARKEKSQQAENLRKMFLAMAEDVRVVLIKLADRLHNMRTLSALPREKQLRIAEQTLEIYAPLAHRLGISQVKWQLEDLAFQYLQPEKYREIAILVSDRRATREKYLRRVIKALTDALSSASIEAEISGRPKHLYSIYQKMEATGRSFDQIYDVLAVRVIVDEVKDCYGALGIIHSHWHPIPGEFDDYIAMPKESMYQSLHTAVIGLDARPMEIQIRTRDMHAVAEYGIAAHWRYKEGSKRDLDFDTKVAWFRRLLEWRDEVADAQEFIESLKSDVFRDQVYVFTPNGDIIDLPAGATPIDFAYRIHTAVGDQCVGAKVNDRLVALDYALKTGEVVKIIKAKSKRGPSRDWLNPNLGYVKTAHAREKIRQWFRKQERDENVAHGRDVLEKELKRLGLENVSFEEVASHFPQYVKLDDFLAAMGYGAVTSRQITAKLVETKERTVFPVSEATRPSNQPPAGISVQGIGNVLTTLARCCNPVPGDQIIGYVTRGRGVTIHRADCHNVRADRDSERLVGVDWGAPAAAVYPVTLRVEGWDRVGLLLDISTILADEKVNITSMQTVVHHDRSATFLISLEVTGIEQLSRLLNRIEGVHDVYEVRREMPVRAAAAT